MVGLPGHATNFGMCDRVSERHLGFSQRPESRHSQLQLYPQLIGTVNSRFSDNHAYTVVLKNGPAGHVSASNQRSYLSTIAIAGPHQSCLSNPALGSHELSKPAPMIRKRKQYSHPKLPLAQNPSRKIQPQTPNVILKISAQLAKQRTRRQLTAIQPSLSSNSSDSSDASDSSSDPSSEYLFPSQLSPSE